MKTSTPNVAQIWKQIEDDLIPRLRLSITDRAVYSHLLRHTFLEGKSRLRFSIAWLSRGTRISAAVRESVRRLVDKGALRLLERSRSGHIVEVCLPDQIRRRDSAHLPAPAGLDDLDFLKDRSLRKFIHARERGLCFYCLRRTNSRTRCLDHVIPRVRRGRNSYRNLVSSCTECNAGKSERSASDFLRALYRDCRLTAAELHSRLRALDALASGKLRPPLPPRPELRGEPR